MSLVKATILHELDFSLNFKRWLQSKRENHYQNATNEYSARIRQIFKNNLKRKQRERSESLKPNKDAGNSNSKDLVVVTLGGGSACQKLTGICIERSNFPGAQENDKAFLIPLKDDDTSEEDTSKRMVFGTVTAVDSSQIRIKFRAPILLESIEQKQSLEKPSEEDEKEKELEKSCEKHCHHSSDEEEIDKEEDKKQEDKNDSEKEESNDADDEASPGDKPSELKKLIENGDGQKSDQDKESKNEDNAAISVALPRVKPINYGIRMEPAEDDSLMNYINSFENAIRKFEKQACTTPLHKCLLGYYSNHTDSLISKPRVVSISELPRPRHQQALAIEQSIKRRISLVEGPAGSGKTLIAAHIACNVARVKDYKVLVCSPLQSTVDRLVELIDRATCVEVIKIPNGRRTRTQASTAQSTTSTQDRRIFRARQLPDKRDLFNHVDDVDILSEARHLDRLVDDEIYWESWHKTKSTFRNNRDLMHEHASRQVTCCSSWRRKKIEQRLMNRANIICCTTGQAGNHLLEELSFDMLILDDAQLISEVDCIVALMIKGLKQVTLLSDMRRQIRLTRVNRNNARLSTTSIIGQPKSPIPVAPTVDVTDNSGDQNHISSTPLNNSASQNDSSQKVMINGQNSFTMTIADRRKAAKKKQQLANNVRNNNKRLSDSNLLAASNFNQNDMINPASPSPSLSSGPSSEPGGLFERWLTIGLPAVDLKHQFRMHETLASFVNYHYYLNRSRNEASLQEKLTQEILSTLFGGEENFQWLPKNNCLTAIFRTKSNTINLKLDDIIEHLLMQENIQAPRIGVIFNRKQTSFADQWQSQSIKFNDTIQCSTIEDFLGQERDFIILVAGCCKEQDQAGQLAELATCTQMERNFMLDDCTLNIALTRARLGLFIITDFDTDDRNTQTTQPIDDGPSTSAAINSTTPEAAPSTTTTQHCCVSWQKLMDYYEINKLIS